MATLAESIERNYSETLDRIDKAETPEDVVRIVDNLTDFYQEKFLVAFGESLITESQKLKDPTYVQQLAPDDISSMYNTYIKYKAAIETVVPDAFTNQESPLCKVDQELGGFFATNMKNIQRTASAEPQI
jgi:hypothetical protein